MIRKKTGRTHGETLTNGCLTRIFGGLDGDWNRYQLFVAGPLDLGKKAAGILAFEGKEGIYLWIVSAGDRKTTSECELTDMLVFDRMAGGGEKIYLSLKDESIACFGKHV